MKCLLRHDLIFRQSGPSSVEEGVLGFSENELLEGESDSGEGGAMPRDSEDM
jgi:hypothetical protein